MALQTKKEGGADGQPENQLVQQGGNKHNVKTGEKKERGAQKNKIKEATNLTATP